MIKRDISISTTFDYSIPIEQQIQLIAKAGFNYISLGAKENHSKFMSRESRKDLKSLLNQFSMSIDTIHGCRADLPNSIDLLSLAAEAAVDLGSKIVVFHPTSFEIKENEINAKIENLFKVCDELKYISKHTSIIFALENIHPGSATDVLRKALPELDKTYFGFCYDSSHDQIDGPRPFDLLEQFKNRIVTVHISDRIKEFVDHVIPGEGFINWKSVCNILKEVKYNRPLLLEIMTSNSKEKEAKAFLELSYNSGCKLYDDIRN